tara:strand:+ start:532 stop:2247 length:1716 start_codon:yes stop_codon:yes gene_type:complete
MATTNIELDIENITGVSDANAQFIISAQKAVVSSIPKTLMKWATSETTAGSHGGDDSPTAITLPVKTDNIIAVRRGAYAAEEAPYEQKAFLEADSGSLLAPSASYPKYFIGPDNTVIVKPDPTSSVTAHALYIDYSNVDDDSDLRTAVIYRSCSSEFGKLATSQVHTWSSPTSPVAPSAPSFGDDLSISVSSPVSPSSPSFTYTDASVSDIIQPLLAISDMASMTVSAPSYNKPVFSLSTFPTITWTFPSVPSVPVLTNSSISFSQTAPTFTPPVMSAPDFADANTWINTEEDSEMLSSRVQAIQAQIGEYSAKMQEAQAVFNKENAEYQAQLQISLQNAQLDSQDDGQVIQKHGSEIGAYQAEVNKVIQGNQQQIAEWQAENSVKLQEYGSDIQNELNVFNKENVEYQQDVQRKVQNLQKDIQEKVQSVQNNISVKKHNLDKSVQIALQNAIQNFQKEVQEYTAKLEKYNAELNQYQGDVAKEVQDYTNTLQKEVQEYQSKVALYTADLQKYQNLIADETQKAATKTQNAAYYMQESDKYYKWYQSEVMAYIQNNSKMISQTIAAQAAQQ